MELFLSGYCRALDGARTVLLDTQEGEADCAWPDCPHKAACPLAQEMEGKLSEHH